MRCPFVRLPDDPAGEIVEALLNEVAGSGQRISAQQGLFIDPPAEIKGEVTWPPVAGLWRSAMGAPRGRLLKPTSTKAQINQGLSLRLDEKRGSRQNACVSAGLSNIRSRWLVATRAESSPVFVGCSPWLH